jgi:uncharacterized membrane protein YeaQ/YmgE (transglycosylase-associated protein family)
MSLLSWLLLGAIAGVLASVVLRGGGTGVVGNIIVGIAGAVCGGLVFSVLTAEPNPVRNFDPGSVLVAFVGACILLVELRRLAGRHNV